MSKHAQVPAPASSQVRVQIDPENMTVDDLIWFDEHKADDFKSAPAQMLKEMLANFVRGPNFEALPREEALCIAGKMSLRQMRDVMQQLRKTMDELKVQGPNPQTGSGSS